ncbi:MAG: ABC transporter ATP-binding protein [Chloroflexi bacterium]|nr:ABC transporter ATP-binding protein [Chloroflexota bacterium]
MMLMSGLDADRYDRTYTDAYLYKRMAQYLKPHRGKVIMIVLMSLLTAVALAMIPILTSEVAGLLEAGAPMAWVGYVLLALLGAAGARYAANWARRRAMTRLVGEMTAQMRKDAVSASVNLDMAFFDQNKSGKILSRITSDTEEFGQTLVLVSDLVGFLVQVFILLAVLAGQSVFLTVVMLAFIPLFLAAAAYFRKLARDVTRQASRALAVVNDNIQESVSGVSVAKNFRRESMIYGEFVEINDQSYDVNLKKGFVLAVIFPVLNAIAGLAIGAILYLGAINAVNGTISVEAWFLFMLSVDRFWFPFINMAAFWSQFQQAMSSIERIFALIDADNTVLQVASDDADTVKGQIRFENVGFGYNDNMRVLEEFNLEIARGESVAFVGHTGAGKSTIAKLIARFYEFQDGRILIDGKDIRSFDIHDYRDRLGLVPQLAFLFNGTVMDNVRYGRPDATDEDIIDIAHSIGDGEWIDTLPDGLQTNVGERGSRLSMGQRQLVSLLRVLVQRPAIFILDEATASIDPFTETQIQEALDQILRQSTSILIAHRLSTVRSADRIIVLDHGKIIEEGNHESLMKAGGHYADLYNTYFRHQSLSYIENAKSLMTEAAK